MQVSWTTDAADDLERISEVISARSLRETAPTPHFALRAQSTEESLLWKHIRTEVAQAGCKARGS